MISLLVPTRQRPLRLNEMYTSALACAYITDDIEMVVYVDEDDATYDGIFDDIPNVTVVRGGATILAEMWNKCAEAASGDILGLLGDDVVFRTLGWDQEVLAAFDKYDDKIVFVYGDDGSDRGKSYGTHFFLHRNWVDTVGYFVPPYFSAGYVDTWWNEVAREIGRHHYVNIFMEHMHQGFGKAENDETYQLGYSRTVNDHVERLYNSQEMRDKRGEDRDKLLKFIEEYRHDNA